MFVCFLSSHSLFHEEYYDEVYIEGTVDLPKLWRVDSSSSDDSTDDEPPAPSEDDKKFMDEAIKVAKCSPDTRMQVCRHLYGDACLYVA